MMIFKREFSRNKKSLIIWSIILVGLILMTLSIYPQFAEQQESMEELLKAYPEPLKKAFGMDTLSLGSLIGFYAIQVYFMTTLLGSIYAVMLAANIVAKEENEKTIEFLLAKPISRSQILTEKLLAVFTNVVILNLVQKYTSKTISCYEEVIARNAPVIFITNHHSIYKSLEDNNKEQSVSKCKSIFIY